MVLYPVCIRKIGVQLPLGPLVYSFHKELLVDVPGLSSEGNDGPKVYGFLKKSLVCGSPMEVKLHWVIIVLLPSGQWRWSLTPEFPGSNPGRTIEVVMAIWLTSGPWTPVILVQIRATSSELDTHGK